MDYSTAMVACARVVDNLTGEMSLVEIPLTLPQGSMQIYVETLTGKIITLDVSTDD